jgi:hypothetical protein
MTNSELKSKVMTLGNKLAPRMGGDRKAAFVQAWIIVREGVVEVRTAGTSFGRRPEALTRLAAYYPTQVRAFIVPEPENPAALKVMVGVQGDSTYSLGLKKHQNIEEFLTAKAKSNLRFTSKKERRIGA